MKIKTTGYVLLVLALFVSALTPLAYKLGSNTNPVALAFYISLLGVVVSFAVMLAKNTQKNILIYIKNPRQLVSFAIVGITYAALILIFSYVTHYVSASLLAVLYRTWPLMLVAATPLLLRTRITKYDALAIAIGFSGLAIAFFGGASLGLSAAVIPFALLLLFAAFIDAIATAVQKRYHYELTSNIFMYNLFTLIGVIPFLLYTGGAGLFSMPFNDIYVILFLGVIQNVILTFLFTGAIRIVKTTVAANAILVVPFLTLLLDWAILKEPIELIYVLVAASVLIGLVVQKLRPSTQTYLSKKPAGSRMPTIYDVSSAFINTKSNLIYENMKGNGRVLAFYKKAEELQQPGVDSEALDLQDNYGCVIFTNKTKTAHIREEELEFIKEMMGYHQDDLLVLGVGKPDDVERRLGEISTSLDSSKRITV